MARIRLTDESLKVLREAAAPGETPGQVLERIIRDVRVNENTKEGGAGLTYQELAARWGRSVPFVKARAQMFRDSGGKRGLGPVRRLGHKSVLVPWETILGYEKSGVW